MSKPLYCFDNYTLDPARRELRRGGEPIPLQPQVFDLLVYLVCNRERVVSKDDLIANIWGGRIVSESALTTRINAARAAIGDSGEDQRLIRTFPRKGIRFVGDVGEEQSNKLSTETSEKTSTQLALPERPQLRYFLLQTWETIRSRSILRTVWWRKLLRVYRVCVGCL